MKSKKGFTLIELVVVMAIIAVLALLVVGAIIVARNTAIRTANRTNAQTLQTGFEAFYARSQTYPELGSDVAPMDFPTAAGATNLNVKLGGGGCSLGGTVVSTTAGYRITPYGAPCEPDGTSNETLDAITGP